MSSLTDTTTLNARPTLVFLHGGGLNQAMWQPQIHDLAGVFQFLTLDLPGHGACASTTFTLAAAVEHVERSISRDNRGRILLVGLSLGGYVAMAYAAKYPERVEGLVLSGCCVQYVGLMGLLARISVSALRFVSIRRFDKMQSRMTSTAAGSEVSEEIARQGFSRRGARDGLKAVIGQDFPAMLRRYHGPLLIVNGEHDRLNRKYENVLTSSSDSAAIEILDDCGHLCSLESPQAFTIALRRFAQGLQSKRMGIDRPSKELS